MCGDKRSGGCKISSRYFSKMLSTPRYRTYRPIPSDEQTKCQTSFISRSTKNQYWFLIVYYTSNLDCWWCYYQSLDVSSMVNFIYCKLYILRQNFTFCTVCKWSTATYGGWQSLKRRHFLCGHNPRNKLRLPTNQRGILHPIKLFLRHKIDHWVNWILRHPLRVELFSEGIKWGGDD